MLSVDIIKRMEELDTEFATTKVFSPGLIRKASEALGLKPDYSILKTVQKVRHGYYSLNSAAVATEKVSKPKPATLKQTVVAETAVQYSAPSVIDYSKKVSKNETYASIPKLDENYVPFGNYKDIEKIIKSRRFFPLFITGHSGNGKSSQVIHICAKNNIPMIRMNMTNQTDEEKLIGTKTLVDGNVVIEEGPLLTAMRSGAVFLVDELDAASPNAILCIQSIMEGKSYFFGLTGEWVHPAPGFNIIATANTKGKGSDDGRYIGTNILNEAFLERFSVTFEQDYPTPAIEKKMVMNWMTRENCVDETFAEELCKWSDATRRTFRDGAIDDLISSRRLEHIVSAYGIYGDKRKSVELCVNRFDTLTKEAFIMLFDKVAAEEPVKGTDDVVV